jgi:hypothetical protein
MPTNGQKAATMRAAKKTSRKSTVDETVNYTELAESKKGMGFDKAAKSVAAKQGIPAERARAVIAAGRAKASKKAVAANPNLKKVPTKGSHKTKGGTYK